MTEGFTIQSLEDSVDVCPHPIKRQAPLNDVLLCLSSFCFKKKITSAIDAVECADASFYMLKVCIASNSSREEKRETIKTRGKKKLCKGLDFPLLGFIAIAANLDATKAVGLTLGRAATLASWASLGKIFLEPAQDELTETAVASGANTAI